MPRVRRQTGTASFCTGAELQRRGLVCERLRGKEQSAKCGSRFEARGWRHGDGEQASRRRRPRRGQPGPGGSRFQS